MKITSKGFSIIEILIVLAIVSIIGAMAVSTYVSGMKTERADRIKNDLLFNADKAVDSIAKKIRPAREAVLLNQSAIEVWVDDNSNGTKEPDEVFTISWDKVNGGTITENRTKTKSVLGTGIAKIGFSLASKGTSSGIGMHLTAQKEGQTVILRNNVWLRNL